MKALASLLVLWTASTFAADTNRIDLGGKSAHFFDLKGREYHARLLRATPDGLIFSTNEGGALQLNLTNLSAGTAATLGIPTNWLETAAARAAARKEAYARGRTSYDAPAGK